MRAVSCVGEWTAVQKHVHPIPNIAQTPRQPGKHRKHLQTFSVTCTTSLDAVRPLVHVSPQRVRLSLGRRHTRRCHPASGDNSIKGAANPKISLSSQYYSSVKTCAFFHTKFTMQRYYSQPYNRLEDPLRPTSTGIGLDPYARDLHPGAGPDENNQSPVQLSRADPFSAQSSTYEPFRPQALPGQPAPQLSDNLRYDQQYGEPSGTPRRRGGLRRCLPNTQTWSRRNKIAVLCAVAVALVVIVAAIAAGIGLALRHDKFTYTPSYAKVTSDDAFWAGGATRASPDDTNDGTATAVDEYTYISGPATNFPNQTRWISFEDMWAINLHTLQTSCKTLGYGSDNS